MGMLLDQGIVYFGGSLDGSFGDNFPQGKAEKSKRLTDLFTIA